MNYADFLNRRQESWLKFEQRLKNINSLSYDELELLAVDYRLVLQDYALVRSRFPGTGVVDKLRALSREGTRKLLRHQPSKSRGGVALFFFERFPTTLRRHLPTIGVAAAIFVVAAVFGLALVIAQPGLTTWILGPEAVADLKQGKMWTESLTSTAPQASSSAIATNNIAVSLTAWAGGALAGALTLWILILNGFHLGSVFAVTMHYSMEKELAEFVAAHAPLELTIIIVASGAGLLLMRGLVAFGDRPRADQLREYGTDSMVLVAGCIPWLILLALIETFLSPRPDVPVAVKITVGIVIFALFVTLGLGRQRISNVEGTLDVNG